MASSKGPMELQLTLRLGLNPDSTTSPEYDLVQVMWNFWLFYFFFYKRGIIIPFATQDRIAEQ